MAKKKITQIANATNIFKFSRKSYDEAMHLLVFARDYFNTRGRIDKLNLSKEDSIVYTLAMSTITTQLTSVLGWLLMCRAVQEGEVKIEDLKSEDFRMPEFDLGVSHNDSCFIILNETMKELLSKSSNMYNRIKRMENSVYTMLTEEGVS